MQEECKILYCLQKLKERNQLQDTGVGSMIVIKQNPREIGGGTWSRFCWFKIETNGKPV